MLVTKELRSTIFEQVKELVYDKFPACQKDEFKDSESLIEAGIVDSMGMLELVVLAESNFDIEIQDVDLTPENFESIEALSSFIESKLDSDLGSTE